MNRIEAYVQKVTANDFDPSKVVTPQIHINGSSARSLAEDYIDAMNVLDDAVDKLKKTAPNGRDYQHDSSKLREATAQWRGHMTNIQNAKAYFEILAEHCVNDPRYK